MTCSMADLMSALQPLGSAILRALSLADIFLESGRINWFNRSAGYPPRGCGLASEGVLYCFLPTLLFSDRNTIAQTRGPDQPTVGARHCG